MLFLTRLSSLLQVSTLAHHLLRTQLLSLDGLWTVQALLHSRPLGPHQIRFICPRILGLSCLSPHHRLALRLLHLSHLSHLYHLPVLQCSRVSPCSSEPFSCDVSSPSSASVAAPLPDSSPAVTATEVAPSGSDGPPLALDPGSRCTTTET